MNPGTRRKIKPTDALRSVIVADCNGRIRCAGTFAIAWLNEYFPNRKIVNRLPATIRRWLANQTRSYSPLELRRSGGALTIRRVNIGVSRLCCLLLEKNVAVRRAIEAMQNGLTQRETEVLSWLAKGKGNWAIGRILDLSPATVRKHLQHIYSKLGVENRTAAAICAVEILRAMGQDL
jgi:DNA-binding CsgD family transcriptional regulator